MSKKKNNLVTQESTDEIITMINQLLKEARKNEKDGLVEQALSTYKGNFCWIFRIINLFILECSELLNQKSIDVGMQIEKKLSKKIVKLEVKSFFTTI